MGESGRGRGGSCCCWLASSVDVGGGGWGFFSILESWWRAVGMLEGGMAGEWSL